MLVRLRNDRVRQAGIVHERVGTHARSALRRNDAGAPVAEAVAIGRNRDRRVEYQIIATDEIGRPGEVNIEVEYHRSRLRTVVNHFETDANLHFESPVISERWRSLDAMRSMELIVSTF